MEGRWARWVVAGLVAGSTAAGAGRARADVAPAAPAAIPMRMEDAVQLALLNNERAQKAPLRIEVADGQLDRARTAFFPTLTAAASSNLHPEDRNNRILTNGATATLSQPLLAPSAFPLYSQARHQLESERWGAAQDRRQLAFDAARGFLNALAAERVLEAATRRLERARANLENAQARAAAQLSSVNDATRAEVDVASATRDVATARGNLDRALVSLGFVIGKRVDGALAPPDQVTRAAEALEVGPNAVKSAVDRRPDVRSASERTLALRASAKEPYYRLVPTLSAQGQIRLTPAPLPTEKAVDESATLALTWSIFDAGVRYTDRRVRVAQAESQALDERLLKRSVEADVSLALASLRAARETFKAAEAAVAAAQRNTEETEILYRNGLARAIELTDANGKRFDAEVSRESAKLAMEQAYLDLRAALGFGPLESEGRP